VEIHFIQLPDVLFRSIFWLFEGSRKMAAESHGSLEACSSNIFRPEFESEFNHLLAAQTTA
jgi:hypothetical protein